jgi:hypothetical protein
VTGDPQLNRCRAGACGHPLRAIAGVTDRDRHRPGEGYLVHLVCGHATKAGSDPREWSHERVGTHTLVRVRCHACPEEWPEVHAR